MSTRPRACTPNSVRYRLGKITAALEVDLADTRTGMELWFVLRHHQPARSPF